MTARPPRKPRQDTPIPPWFALLLAMPLGAFTVLGFAPVGLSFAAFVTLAILFQRWAQAHTPREAFCTGYGFGLGFFLAGVSWIYVSLHTFGAMPAPIAALATLLFCAFLALFPAIGGYLVARSRCSLVTKLALLAPALWTLIEWTRGWIFTGFPWLTVGYTQPPDNPLAGYAALTGVYGISLALALTAGGVALVILHPCNRIRRGESDWGATRRMVSSRESFPILVVVASLVLLWIGGALAKRIEWTQPTGVTTTVELLQGNVAQDMKWREENLIATLDAYRDMVKASKARLIVLPETALPLFLHQVPPEYLEELAAHARRNHGDILIGVPERLPAGNYYNSVISLGSAKPQGYRKSHLVPFGEFIPLRPLLGWIVGVLAIPLQDFSRGGFDQTPLEVAGQRVAVNICYEDVFGEEIIRQLPAATMLVNASNVAWFGRSIAPDQHLQISQMRAMESGRYMLRATNTGMTAVINERGQVVASAKEFTRATVTYAVPGFQGATPFVRWGNAMALSIAAAMLLVAALLRLKSGDSL
jgi:apolipoprotein N-acyltransferase